MSFLKNLTDNLSKAAEITVQKTGEVSEIAKLKLKETKASGEADDMYKSIGMLVYKQYKDASDEAEAIAAKCLELDQKHAEIAEITAKIAEIKAAAEEKKVQRKAAAEAARNAAAAAAEAAEAPAEEEADAEEAPVTESAEEEVPMEESYTEPVKEAATVICAGCGKEIPAAALFCPECGQKQGE